MVRFISMDMNDVYRSLAKIYFKNAICCADPFHVVKNINDELDRIRCKVMNRYKNNKASDEYYLLKKQNHLLFIDSLKLSDEHIKYNHHFKYKMSQTLVLQKILEIDDELKCAYDLKELYAIFNSSNDPMDKIGEKLDAVIDAFILSGIPSFSRIGNTMKNWREEIINSFHTYNGRRISNGPIEGRNKYIGLTIDMANGFRNFKRFRNRIMYIFNKYEKPSEVALETKTIKLPGKERGRYKKK